MKNRHMLYLLALLTLLSALFAFSSMVRASPVSQPTTRPPMTVQNSQAQPGAVDDGGCAAWVAQSQPGTRVSWKACMSYQGAKKRLAPDEILSFRSNTPSLFASCEVNIHLIDETTDSIVQTVGFDCTNDARKSLQLKGYPFLSQPLDCSHLYYTEANVAFVYNGVYGGGTWSSSSVQGFRGGIGDNCL